jgi:uncharacterized phage protein (TIGR02216 family)
MTPRELSAVLRARRGAVRQPIDRSVFRQMMDRYPDSEGNHDD